MSIKGDEAYILGMNYTEESLKGAGALKGEKGDPGKDGFSPIATVTKSNGVSTFTVTDSTDTTTVEIFDGADGADGKDGATPTIGADNHWYINGVDTGVVAQGQDGQDGADGLDGQDGRSITSITKDDNDNIIVTFSDNTTQNIGKLSVDVQADFLTSDGFGKLRFTDNKFQYYDEESSQWVDTFVTPDNTYIITLTPQPMEKFIATCNPDTMNVELRIDESKDTIIDGQSLCIVEKVIIRRKKDDFPTDENDGDLVLEIERKDFGTYKNKPYVDIIDGASVGDVYCYKAFPVSNTGTIANLVDNESSCTIKEYWLFGFKLDQNESDPSSMISYIENNENYRSAYMNYSTDMFDYGDWEDAWFIRNLKPCMLNFDGTVAYELDKNDYSLRADGTPSGIANDSFGGNAMVGIPKVYWKIVDNGDDTANIYFSDKKLDDDFVCWSHIDNNGNEIDYCYMPIYNGSNIDSKLRSLSGKAPINGQKGATEITLAKANNLTSDIIWYTEVFSDRMLINLLLLLIGKSTDTQTTFGNGHYTGGSSASTLLATGTLNDKGLFYGTNGTGKAVKVFGIENWWGNQYRRIAGWINDNGNQKIKMTYGQSDGSTVDGYNTDGSGYISIGCTPSGTSKSYNSKMTITKNGLIPTEASGSATTYYTDGLWANNSQVDYACVGGQSNDGLCAGALCSILSYADSYGAWTHSAAVSCKPLATT